VHPNVIVVHDVAEDAGRPCIVMEYVPAPTLADALKGGRTLPPDEAARIGLGMIGAVRAAHTAGVLHRDIKPANVLLGAGGRVVLTDFGIARTDGSSTLTRTGEMVGSIDFMAPERIRGRDPGPASDLWSLGATLYQAVEGCPPYRRDTAMETAYAIAVAPLEPMRQAGPLAPLVEALLAKDPADRPTAEQAEQALRAVASGASPTGTASSADLAVLRPENTRYAASASPARHAPPTPSAPSGGHREDSGDPHERRRGRRRPRRALVPAVTALVVASAVAAAFYASSHEGGAEAGAHRTGDTSTGTASATPSPVPDGYHLVRDQRLGVSFPVPDGWQPKKGPNGEVTYADPTGLAGITVGMVDPAGSHPIEHFTDIEANTKVNYATYRRLRMQRTTFKGKPAAVWEFTFRGRARVFRAIDLGYGTAGGREYDIYLSAPDARWDTYRPVFDHVRDGFTD
jgi:hypothetical protein